MIDFEKRKGDIRRTEQKIAELRERYGLLEQEVAQANETIASKAKATALTSL